MLPPPPPPPYRIKHTRTRARLYTSLANIIVLRTGGVRRTPETPFPRSAPSSVSPARRVFINIVATVLLLYLHVLLISPAMRAPEEYPLCFLIIIPLTKLFRSRCYAIFHENTQTVSSVFPSRYKLRVVHTQV